MKHGPELKTVLAFLLVSAVTLAACEAVCWGFFYLYADRFLFYDTSRFVAKLSDVAIQYATFDPELGWRTKYKTKYNERPGKLPLDNAIMSVFGGSFAQGGVAEDDATISERMSEVLGRRVINFGVGMYGVDQAVLRFEQKTKQIKTPYAMLIITAFNTGEDVNVYNRFYYPLSVNAVTKPRFEIDGDSLRLLPNPIQRVEDRVRLTDPLFIEQLGQHDFWFNREDLPIRRFPYSHLLFDRRLWKQIDFSGKHQINENTPLAGEDILAIPVISEMTMRLLDRFVIEARQNQIQPIIAMLPHKGEIARREENAAYYPKLLGMIKQHCTERGWTCLIPLDEIESIFPGDKKVYFANDGHYSKLGERAMGDWIAAQLQRR